MTRSAVTFPSSSVAVDALLVLAHPRRWPPSRSAISKTPTVFHNKAQGSPLFPNDKNPHGFGITHRQPQNAELTNLRKSGVPWVNVSSFLFFQRRGSQLSTICVRAAEKPGFFHPSTRWPGTRLVFICGVIGPDARAHGRWPPSPSAISKTPTAFH